MKLRIVLRLLFLAFICGATISPCSANGHRAVPNAYYDFLAAGKMVKDGDRVIDDGVSADPSSRGYGQINPAEESQIVVENLPALNHAREGFQHAYVAPLVDFYTGSSLGELLELMRHDWELETLFLWQGDIYARKGDFSDAIKCNLDAIELGTKALRGSGINGAHQAWLGNSPAEYRVQPWISHLTPIEARDCAAKLDRINERRQSYAESLREEERMFQYSINRLTKRPDWVDIWLKESDIAPGYSKGEGFLVQTLSKQFGQTIFVKSYSEYMDSEIRIVNQSYPLAIKEAATTYPDDPISWSILGYAKAQGYRPFYRKDCFDRARLQMLVIELVEQAYDKDHNAYSRTLSALVPKYIGKLPSDPFTLGKPFHYRRNGAGYLLYSIGPDCVDDGGKPILESSAIGRNGARSGDIVAGILSYD
jgi:hypothetical protein